VENKPKTGDMVVDYMVQNHIPLTISNYLAINYMGDVKDLSEVGPEDRAEIERLLEDGFLVDTNSNDLN
jgi:hypothetical protein